MSIHTNITASSHQKNGWRKLWPEKLIKLCILFYFITTIQLLVWKNFSFPFGVEFQFYTLNFCTFLSVMKCYKIFDLMKWVLLALIMKRKYNSQSHSLKIMVWMEDMRFSHDLLFINVFSTRFTPKTDMNTIRSHFSSHFIVLFAEH